MLYLVDGKKFVSVGPQQHVEQPLSLFLRRFNQNWIQTGGFGAVSSALFHASWTLDQRKVWLLEVFLCCTLLWVWANIKEEEHKMETLW